MLTTSDFPLVCRICLQKVVLLPIDEYCMKLIETVVNIDVTTEINFPKNICNACVKFLEEISIFYNKTKYNNIFLNYLILNDQNTVKEKSVNEICDIEVNQINNFTTKTEQIDVPKNAFEQHKNVGNDKKKHLCAKIKCKECQCDSDFDSQPLLENHLNIYNSPVKSYNKISKSELKNFVCPTCSKTFAKNQYLRKHIARHTCISIQTKHNDTQNCTKTSGSILALNFFKKKNIKIDPEKVIVKLESKKENYDYFYSMQNEENERLNVNVKTEINYEPTDDTFIELSKSMEDIVNEEFPS